jgi:hypothetical protein
MGSSSHSCHIAIEDPRNAPRRSRPPPLGRQSHRPDRRADRCRRVLPRRRARPRRSAHRRPRRTAGRARLCRDGPWRYRYRRTTVARRGNRSLGHRRQQGRLSQPRERGRGRCFWVATTPSRWARSPASPGTAATPAGRSSCCGSMPMATSTPGRPPRPAISTACRWPASAASLAFTIAPTGSRRWTRPMSSSWAPARLTARKPS